MEIELPKGITILDLYVVPLASYDIILGMDWLMAYKALVEFQERWIEYTNETQTQYRIYSDQGQFEPYLITTMQVRRNIRKGEMIYVAKVMEIEQDEKDVEIFHKCPMLKEYRDVFFDELPRLLPKIEFDFSIDLVPRA